ncbi:MAG: VanZ family protein [Bacillota bacterium]|nr:MAG: VanZ family protein [Bacillota bacterium]MBS3949447.1 VanZ family protein [Peptococcaceae bacterium]
MRIHRSFRWLAVIVWVGFIWFMSSHSVPPGDPIGKVADIIRTIPVQLTLPGTSVEFMVGKAGHLLAYSLLGVLLLAATWGRLKNRVLGVMLIGVMVAVIDETRQYFVPGREAAVRDVVIDAVGLAIGIIIALSLRKAYLTRLAQGEAFCSSRQ